MFDFSFGEISLVAVIALLVLGPERLPKVARTAGALVRRARNSWQSVRDEIERELAADDLKRTIKEARDAAADLRTDLNSAVSQSHTDMQSVARDLHDQTIALPPAMPTGAVAVEPSQAAPADTFAAVHAPPLPIDYDRPGPMASTSTGAHSAEPPQVEPAHDIDASTPPTSGAAPK